MESHTYIVGKLPAMYSSMTNYYHITQLTGQGYEALLDPVTSELIAWFVDGYLFGRKAVSQVMEDQNNIVTVIAA